MPQQIYRLQRVASSDKGTFGVLCLGAIPICVTCEDPWNDNQTSISCIPKGVYQCDKYSSEKFKDVWELKDVPNRSSILIHNGNSIADTHGCILVGKAFGTLSGMPAVVQSRDALDMLRAEFPDSFVLSIV